jgi:cobalamin 5'-phosphate synthase/cobalamin synthase
VIVDFVAAVAFLTRIPVGRRFSIDQKAVGRSARWFPLIGGLLGGISAGVLWVLAPVFPALVTAILVTGLATLLTGALHLDGLADTADGFGGGATREDVLRIMRDHAIGSYGGIALVLVIALKVAAIASLIGSSRALPALILAPVLGRWSAVLLSATQPYARPEGGDRTSAGAPSKFVGKMELIVATITAMAFVAGAASLRAVLAAAAVAVLTAAWAWCCRRRIGGVTGDTLGAGVEMSECVVLLMFCAR